MLARLAHGVADGTIRGEIAAVEQFLEHAGVLGWEVEPAHADRFLGQAQRHQAPGTRRGKAGGIDLFFRFLEARYRGEICELTGRVVASPIDDCNRPRHSGDFQVRVPPSPAALAAFFAAWRGELPTARKWLAAARHYAMARLAGEAGCGWGAGRAAAGGPALRPRPARQIHVRMGKGSRGSGPRERLVPMLGDARPLLIWWVSEVAASSPTMGAAAGGAVPSERGGPIGGDTFAAALNQAAAAHLRGPVTKLTPHVRGMRARPGCMARASAWPRSSSCGSPVAVDHDPLRARRRRGDRARLPAGGRTGRRPVQGVEGCNGTCGWPPPSGASGGPRTCGGCWPRRAWRSRPGRCRTCGPASRLGPPR